MNKLILTLVLATCSTQFSFSQQMPKKTSGENQVFKTDWSLITRDYMTWYQYSYYNVRLSQDFIGLDIDSSEIEKTIFIKKLLEGDKIAFNTMIKNGQPVYQLFKFNSNDKSIKAVNMQLASTALIHLKMEGQQLPDYTFTDLDGNIYNNTSAKGKITVLKCWFIHCVACIAEFPELNKLVNQYKNNPGIQFISLATDDKADLVKFLKKKKFNYRVVPAMEKYISDSLKITGYPTHILIDRNGKIVKVVNTVDELIPFLEKELNETLHK